MNHYLHIHKEHAPKGKYSTSDLTPTDKAEGWVEKELFTLDNPSLFPLDKLMFTQDGGDTWFDSLEELTKERRTSIGEVLNVTVTLKPWIANYKVSTFLTDGSDISNHEKHHLP